MQVILLEKIQNVGNMGDIVNVKPGFARNFLLPESKALPATPENKTRYEAQKAELEKENKARRDEAEQMAQTLKDKSVHVERQSSEMGQLYGSVKPGDIQKELEGMGCNLPRGSVHLGEPIKTTGDFTAKVYLHPEVVIDVPVSVTRQSA